MRSRSVLGVVLALGCAAQGRTEGVPPPEPEPASLPSAPADAASRPRPPGAPDAAGEPAPDVAPDSAAADAAPRADAAAEMAAAPDVIADRAPVPSGPVCPAGLPLCLDFEDGQIPAGWSAVGPVAVDATRAFHGRYALHVSTGGRRNAYIRGRPPRGPTLYGRTFFRMAAPTPQKHISFVEATGRGAGGTSIYTLGAQFGRFFVGWIPLPWSGREAGITSSSSPAVIPTDRWICLEWLFDGKTGEPARVWSDGQPLSLGRTFGVGVDGSRWGTVDGFDSVIIGFSTAHEVPAYELWLDGVALAESRIGCGGAR